MSVITELSAQVLSTDDLSGQIIYHNEKYFNDEPEISDAEYDILIKELKSRDPEHPTLTKVGALPSYGKKVKHNEIMGSLEKVTYDEKGELTNLIKWCDGRITACSHKMDGLAARLVYKKGKLVLAATRGNGEVGQDITDNIKVVPSIPNTISFNEEDVEIRGELYMKKSHFQEFKKEMEKAEKKVPANPRNATSGIINQKDPDKVAGKFISFMVYDVIFAEDDIDRLEEMTSEIMKRETFYKLFPELDYVNTNLVFEDPSDIKNRVKIEEKERHELDYNIDGLVFSINAIKEQRKLGYKGKCPVGKIAFKFRPEQQRSIVIDIDWQLGRTGKLTPVAKIEPVEIDCSTVDSPTLHNYAQIKRLDLCISDEVIVEKAGDIIPQVVKVSKKNLLRDRKHYSVINYPRVCPVCFEPTSLDEKEVNVWCQNSMCPGQREFRIIHFLKTIKAEGIGPGIVKALVKADLVQTIPDMYQLDWGEVRDLPGLGEKSAQKIVHEMERHKKIPLATFLDALGIEGLGTTTSKILADTYQSIEKVLSAPPYLLKDLEGVGHVVAHSIVDGLSKNIDMIRELQDVGVEIENKKTIMGGLTGQSFCITGTLSIGRKEMASLIESHGGTIKSSVSKGLDYLVAGDKTGKSKLDKAEKYGTEVIDEDTLRKMMGE